MCLFVPNCSLLKSFRIQNWRRGWDPECKQSVHMAVIIGKIWVLLTRGPRNLVIMPIDLKHMLRRMTSTMTKKWMFFWLLLVQTLTSCWRICAIQKIRMPKTFTRLTQLLQRHYEPAPIVIAEKHKFWTASQGESESVSEFVVRLKKLASSCSFGEFLSQALRDRLVSELHSKSQRHFLSIYYNWRAPTKDLIKGSACRWCSLKLQCSRENTLHCRCALPRPWEVSRERESERTRNWIRFLCLRLHGNIYQPLTSTWTKYDTLKVVMQYVREGG